MASVSTTTADAALKAVYGDYLKEQINTGSTAVYNKFQTSTRNIQGGKEVVKLAPFGVHGGTGSTGESAALPTAGKKNFVQFKSAIKSLYGVIEITDKAIESSKYDQGAFINLLQTEMDSLLAGAKHSYGRQVYLDGTGNLTACGVTSDSTTVNVASTQYLVEGMIVDIVATATGVAIDNGSARRIALVDRKNNQIVLEGATGVTTAATNHIIEQGSLNNELTGFGAVFASAGTLYGLNKANYPWLVPQLHTNVGAISDRKIQSAMLDVSNFAGGKTDFLVCSPDVWLEYADYLEATKRQLPAKKLTGGFEALDFAGKELLQDRFVKSGCMYLLDTSQWTFHHLTDWAWMEDDKGAVLKQVPGYAKYTATLRKHAELICDHPGAQALLSGITVA